MRVAFVHASALHGWAMLLRSSAAENLCESAAFSGVMPLCTSALLRSEQVPPLQSYFSLPSDQMLFQGLGKSPNSEIQRFPETPAVARGSSPAFITNPLRDSALNLGETITALIQTAGSMIPDF